MPNHAHSSVWVVRSRLIRDSSLKNHDSIEVKHHKLLRGIFKIGVLHLIPISVILLMALLHPAWVLLTTIYIAFLRRYEKQFKAWIDEKFPGFKIVESKMADVEERGSLDIEDSFLRTSSDVAHTLRGMTKSWERTAKRFRRHTDKIQSKINDGNFSLKQRKRIANNIASDINKHCLFLENTVPKFKSSLDLFTTECLELLNGEFEQVKTLPDEVRDGLHTMVDGLDFLDCQLEDMFQTSKTLPSRGVTTKFLKAKRRNTEIVKEIKDVTGNNKKKLQQFLKKSELSNNSLTYH